MGARPTPTGPRRRVLGGAVVRGARAVAGVVVAVVALVACSDDGSTTATSAVPSTRAPAGSPSASSDGATTSMATSSGPSTTDGASASSPGSGDASTSPSTNPVIQPTLDEAGVPVTEPVGVPGLDDADAFCAAWAQWTATGQVLRIAAGFGALDGPGLARLELIASPVVVDAIRTMGEALPAELESERSAFVEGVLGPSARRADAGVEALSGALATDELDDLRAAWLESLRTRDPEQPVPDVVLPAEVDEALVPVAGAFDAARTPFAQDPSLDTSAVPTPSTDAHVEANCADLTALGVGDAL